MGILLPYLLLVNALGFYLMLADKEKAIKHRRRIPESTLLGIAVAGGSIGTLLAMWIFRHKTRHRKFTVSVPLLIIAQIGLLILIAPLLSNIGL